MNGMQITKVKERGQSSPLLYFLGFVFCLFVGILIFVYMVTKRTHPVYVDEHGKPVNSESSSQSGSVGSANK